jgi:hypothetical protein
LVLGIGHLCPDALDIRIKSLVLREVSCRFSLSTEGLDHLFVIHGIFLHVSDQVIGNFFHSLSCSCILNSLFLCLFSGVNDSLSLSGIFNSLGFSGL